MNTSVPKTCFYCHRPVRPDNSVWLNGYVYHKECTESPYAKQKYTPEPMFWKDTK